MPPIHKGFKGQPASHDFFWLDALEGMRVFFGKKKYGVIHLLDESFQVFRRKETYLVRLGVFIEISRDADVPPLVALLVVGRVVAYHMPTRTDNGIAHRDVERLRRFWRGNARTITFLV